MDVLGKGAGREAVVRFLREIEKRGNGLVWGKNGTGSKGNETISFGRLE